MAGYSNLPAAGTVAGRLYCHSKHKEGLVICGANAATDTNYPRLVSSRRARGQARRAQYRAYPSIPARHWLFEIVCQLHEPGVYVVRDIEGAIDRFDDRIAPDLVLAVDVAPFPIDEVPDDSLVARVAVAGSRADMPDHVSFDITGRERVEG